MTGEFVLITLPQSPFHTLFFFSRNCVFLFVTVCVYTSTVYVSTAIMFNKLTTCTVCVKAECVKQVYSHINITLHIVL